MIFPLSPLFPLYLPPLSSPSPPSLFPPSPLLTGRHVGILYIKGTSFKMEPIPLQCVRPFVMDSVVLSQTGIHYREEEQIVAYLAEKVPTGIVSMYMYMLYIHV